jgi:hypothetical protein
MEMWSLFLNAGITDSVKMRYLILAQLILWTAVLCAAQDSSSPQPAEDQEKEEYGTYDLLQSGRDPESAQESSSSQPTDYQDQEGFSTYDLLQSGPNPEAMQNPIPVPIRTGGEAKSLGDQSIVDDVFQNPQNRWGFSLSGYLAYSNDVSVLQSEREDAGILAILPRVFVNIGKRRSRLHLDAGAGYRSYHRHSELNNWDYYGSAQYSYQLSKHTTFQIADQFTSSYNDAWSFLSQYSPLSYDPTSSNEVLFNRQRINRNSIRAELNHQAGRRISMGVFGGYRLFRYPQRTLSDSDIAEAGARIYFQLADWFYLSGNFSTHADFFGGDYPRVQIYRLQAAGVDFHLSNSWRLWANGGIDILDYEGYNQIQESISAGLGYTSLNAAFSVMYQRGFTSAVGLSRLLMTDFVGVGLGYRVTPRINARLEGYYYRNTEPNNGVLETFSVGGGPEFALCDYLVLIAKSYYQNQQAHNFSVEGLGLNRFTAYLGLQFVVPARKDVQWIQEMR